MMKKMIMAFLCLAISAAFSSCKDDDEEPEITERVFNVEYVVTADRPDVEFYVSGDISFVSSLKQYIEAHKVTVKKNNDLVLQVIARSDDADLLLTAEIYVDGELVVSQTKKGEVLPAYYEKINWGK